MRKLILIVHTSLDGFVAGPHGELDGFEQGEENLDFVCDLTDSADAALFGRISYQLLNDYWPTAKEQPHASKPHIRYSEWYNQAQKIVVSRAMHGLEFSNTTIISDGVSNRIADLKQQAGKDILIFGSPSISQMLMKHNLIDSYWVFVNPIIFGRGIHLFTGAEDKTKLKLSATRQFSNGELALHYVVVR